MSSEVRRGDIAAFEYRENKALSYAQRVVGLPGDRISYYNKRLKVNDQEVPRRRINDYVHKDRPIRSLQYLERLGDREFGDLSPQETSTARCSTYSNSSPYGWGRPADRIVIQ